MEFGTPCRVFVKHMDFDDGHLPCFDDVSLDIKSEELDINGDCQTPDFKTCRISISRSAEIKPCLIKLERAKDVFSPREKRSKNFSLASPSKMQKLSLTKCLVCNQTNFNLTTYDENGETELVLVTIDELTKILDDSSGIPKIQCSINDFLVYASCGHPCRFDSGLLEKGVLLYVSGNLTSIASHDSDNSYEGTAIGPIDSWWIAGFDEGEMPIVGLTTSIGDYYLKTPASVYAPLFQSVLEKIHLTKIVLEQLENDTETDYGELISCVNKYDSPAVRLSEELLVQHSHFIISQIQNYDEDGGEEDIKLMQSPCIKNLFKLAGPFVRPLRNSIPRLSFKRKHDKMKQTLATTTELVRSIFDVCFKGALLGSKCDANVMDVCEFGSLLSNCTDKSEVFSNNGIFVNGSELVVGDYVCCKNNILILAIHIERVVHGRKLLHLSETILGDNASKYEVVLTDECCNVNPSSILHKVNVVEVKFTDNWQMSSGQRAFPSPLAPNQEHSGNWFYFHKQYVISSGRFEDVQPSILGKSQCGVCLRNRTDAFVQVVDGVVVSVLYQNQKYSVGDGVYLSPKSWRLDFPTVSRKTICARRSQSVDHEIYTEAYRKSPENVEEKPISPYIVGVIKQINAKKGRQSLETIDLLVVRMARPEEIHMNAFTYDLNQLYKTFQTKTISLSSVLGRCSVYYKFTSFPELLPDVFYYNSCINEGVIESIPENSPSLNKYISNPSTPKQLRCLDIFAGCGGLSEGLRQSGIVSDSGNWAIEACTEAAEAFKLNHPNTRVLNKDCNEVLSEVLMGMKCLASGEQLPQRGEIDLICGGPPCQGFSGMNRFHKGLNSQLKNSLIATFLSYVDFYRPNYFILENVRNFVSYQNSLVLKLTLNALFQMGYQCSVGILQAGNYGVPQSRRRTILIAAAPGLKLPLHPEPTHCFPTGISMSVDNVKYKSNIQRSDCAPFRMITVRDALIDLPSVSSGHSKLKIRYTYSNQSHYQRLLRANCAENTVSDHIVKSMTPLVDARMALIPTEPGADWRDLPNISIQLCDGSYCQVLHYSHYDQIKSLKRGVCACAEGNKCDPDFRVSNTLIPWCLPHTANRHNQWAGLYGRLNWDGYFATTVTNPEPMGKQGRVLHPEQNRVVSVRECARSQGFRDSYLFYGTIVEKHRQIGNAVPPVLACAVGREILKCII